MTDLEKIQMSIDASFNVPFGRVDNQEAKVAVQALIDMDWTSEFDPDNDDDGACLCRLITMLKQLLNEEK